MIARVVSACHRRQAEVWRLTSRAVPEKIQAASYELICPDDQVADFRAISGDRWTISPDSRYLDGHDAAFFDHYKIYREGVGWYIQQMVKLRAAAAPDLYEDAAVLIWDSDSVPLRNIQFISPEGRLRYFEGQEDQQPYFRTMEKLAGIRKTSCSSFVAQCLPSRTAWVRELIGEIERRSGKPFSEAVFECLDGIGEAEFSEYETLGNFVLSRHPDAMIPNGSRWERNGGLVVSPARNRFLTALILGIMACRYSHVSFESWQRPSLTAGLGILARIVKPNSRQDGR